MNDALMIMVSLGYAYLVGSVPTAYIVARLRKGVDIRRYGSGNIGASNAAHHVGKGWFFVVLAFDSLAKGSASVGLARALGLDLDYQALAALIAIAGHNWSPYIGFSGGRGISVASGGLLVLAWKELVALLGVAVLGWLVFRSAGLWFGIALLLLPISAILFGEPVEIVVFCVALLLVSALKRVLSNPGTAPEGLRWRDMAIPRLLYDRDTSDAGDWTERTPGENED